MLYLVLASVDYEEGSVLGIFDTERKANNRMKRFKGYADHVWVQPIKLNTDIEEVV